MLLGGLLPLKVARQVSQRRLVIDKSRWKLLTTNNMVTKKHIE